MGTELDAIPAVVIGGTLPNGRPGSGRGPPGGVLRLALTPDPINHIGSPDAAAPPGRGADGGGARAE
ncbi:hypothetical protein CLM85_33660 [Streptomyces albidoflavus]|nr:hypothetical protein CLM85_33660 [Streptomyces albidoflavus]